MTMPMSGTLVRISLRRDTSQNWTTSNPVLGDGEEGYETNTRKRKVGNGSLAWVDLPYDNEGGTSAIPPVATTTEQYGTSYTLALADAGSTIEMNNAAANSIIIPNNDVVAFPIGTMLAVGQTGPGLTTVTPAAGVLLSHNNGTAASGAKALSGLWSEAVLRKRSANQWILTGAIA